MAKFKVWFIRTVETIEHVEREIEADNKAEALAFGDTRASAFNLDCPDDVSGDVTECGSWRVDDSPFGIQEIEG